MTALMGIICSDGVVIGSDSSATFAANPQFRTIEQKTKKIEIIDDRVIVGGTGEMGLGQRFCEVIRQLWTKSDFRRHPPQHIVKEFSKAGIDDFAFTQAQRGTYGALIAFPCGKTFHLCELAITNFQPEFKNVNMWFVSMGSGQPITDPFLALLKRVFWKSGQPTVNEAVFAITWALQHVIELNPGGVNGPPQIAVLKMEGDRDPQLKARLLDDAAIQEHINNVQGAEDHLAKYRETLMGKGNVSPVPSPPQSSIASLSPAGQSKLATD
jgi:hypothetical protein